MAIMGRGLVLMIAGMGIVFAFLYVMIVTCKKVSAFVSRYDYLVPDEPKKTRKVSAPAATAQVAAV